MNYNRILRATNFLFICAGYQVQWFSVATRIFKLHAAPVIYLILLTFWYAACFREHFLDSSIFGFLKMIVPALHNIIRFHLLMGLKIWIFVIFEMRYITKALNDFIKILPSQTNFKWSWKDLNAFIWLFSGLLINMGFAFYIMFEMEFMLPTMNQIMHASALFLPHFALACSFKVLNLASLVSKSELESIHSKINDVIQNDSPIRKKDSERENGVELSSQPSTDLEIKIPDLETLQLLVRKLQGLVSTTSNINQVIQKQMLFLFVMNSISMLGAGYIIVYYNSKWHLILEGPLGNSLYAFNVGVFVFIFWDYFCICFVNYSLESVKFKFLKDVIEILRRKLPLEEDKRIALKDMKKILKNNFNMRIFFRMPIIWQTLFTVNILVGLAIALFICFHYLNDNIENLEAEMNMDEE
ncbi:uncharacterized protein LOC129912530 [Episyrphus balteatus]|uniref:uncharacterized protein LOC129912530 n=1 Tax=Episyrphus balteatus TaxID=286459 RepID=UPI0024860604|nr:uncharacterized protein LOC129912530 [Episyrphus balteatus]